MKKILKAQNIRPDPVLTQISMFYLTGDPKHLARALRLWRRKQARDKK